MEEKLLENISKKLNVLISLSLRNLSGQTGFESNKSRRKGIGDVARYLANMGVDAKEIAEILGAPLPSIRTLLTPKRQK